MPGLASLAIAFVSGERISRECPSFIPPALLLGVVAYGLSIFTYIRAQKELGAAKTSAYYAIAPFIGAFLSFVILKENDEKHTHHHELEKGQVLQS